VSVFRDKAGGDIGIATGILLLGERPGSLTSRDYSSDDEATCEGVVNYVEQAVKKSML